MTSRAKGDPAAVMRSATIVTWNLRHTGADYSSPQSPLVQALSALRPDLMVLQETIRGNLPISLRTLGDKPATYRSIVGRSSGDQRIAMLYNLDRMRLKTRPRNLLEGQMTRMPLWAHFAVIDPNAEEPIDLQVVGLHLKSRGGNNHLKRVAEVEALSGWILGEAPNLDADLLLAGDWNGPSFDEGFEALTAIERQGGGVFRGLNGAEGVGFFMSRLRKPPHPDFSRGEVYLNTSSAIRSRLTPQSAPAASAAAYEPVLLPDLIDKKAYPELASLIGRLSGSETGSDLAPQVLTIFFQQFELI
uniref:Endonuclease/exonuclease/phosphatase n=1 Tax=Caulobacter sp. (strain K31) TaxID=366602 RepID=B0T599_CAUSK